MRSVILSIAALMMSLALLTSDAHAQNQNDQQSQQKVKTYDFSGDTIDGDLLRPDGDVVDTRGFASHSSLIRIRTDFIKEILKSAEDL